MVCVSKYLEEKRLLDAALDVWMLKQGYEVVGFRERIRRDCAEAMGEGKKARKKRLEEIRLERMAEEIEEGSSW